MPKIYKKRDVVLSTLIGFLIAIATRASIVLWTPFFTYYKIGPFVHDTNLATSGGAMDQTVLGLSGFPFHTFSDCSIQWYDMAQNMYLPACNSVSPTWELSVPLNILFWSLVVYGVLTSAEAIKNLFRKQGR